MAAERSYAVGDPFVLPTFYEAFPLVAREAAAAGLRLLVTAVNVRPHVVEHVPGFTYSTGAACTCGSVVPSA